MRDTFYSEVGNETNLQKNYINSYSIFVFIHCKTVNYFSKFIISLYF